MTWGRFLSTHGLKAEPEVRLCGWGGGGGGGLIWSRQEYPNLLQWGIWVPAQRSRSFYDLLFSETSRYPGKRTHVYQHRWCDGE